VSIYIYIYIYMLVSQDSMKPNKKWFQDEGENGMSLLIIKKEKNIRAFAFILGCLLNLKIHQITFFKIFLIYLYKKYKI